MRWIKLNEKKFRETRIKSKKQTSPREGERKTEILIEKKCQSLLS